MLYKTLKHKTLPDTFGVVADGYEDHPMPEISHSSVPDLMPYSATREGLIGIMETDPINKTIIEQLKDYDLVTVSIMILTE